MKKEQDFTKKVVLDVVAYTALTRYIHIPVLKLMRLIGINFEIVRVRTFIIRRKSTLYMFTWFAKLKML